MTAEEADRLNGVSDALADVSLDIDGLVVALEKKGDDGQQGRYVRKKLRQFADRLGMASLNLQEIRMGI